MSLPLLLCQMSHNSVNEMTGKNDRSLVPARSMDFLPSHNVKITKLPTQGVLDSNFPGIKRSQRAAENMSGCKAWNIS
jgi:hypothetical protein